ncbi:MAG: tryptophan synthase subunit alpha [Candidatus Thermoplasmatota archaeon]|nr:tryptophan synthase subunit alpha [Candidatus Thermoplasmatota archaeon]
MSRLQDAFGTPQLVGYLVGNHPDPDTFLDNATALIENGVGVLEVGIPFSDPVADGPTIQEAVVQAMDQGTRPRDVLDLCGRLRERHPETPLVVMTYANLAYKMGYGRFADQLRENGVDGAILADLPPEHAGEVQAAFGHDLDLIFLASPATSDARLEKLCTASRGFLYLVGLFGVTGERAELDPRTVSLVERVAPVAEKHSLPVAVGFGISKGEHAARLVEAGARGVVVGSAFVRKVLDGAPARDLGSLAQELSQAIREARAP